MSYPTARAQIPSYAYAPAQANKRTGFIKNLIWLYAFLLLIEGGLRKWVLPGFSDWLLLIRDPLVIFIYMAAMSKGCFPRNGFIITLFFLGVFALLGSLCTNDVHGIVLVYGLRANFLHIPLIFVMGSILERKDIERMGTFFLWSGVLMSALIIYQFHSPQDARINFMPGAQIGGIIGAKGRFRPAGTFSFITGIASFYPLVTAFLFQQFIGKRQFKWIVTAFFATAVACAIPFSISRQNALACGLVILFSIPAALWAGRNIRYLYRISIGSAILAGILSLIPFFAEGVSTFMERWTSSTGEDSGGVQTALVDRYLSYLTDPLTLDAPFFGYGIGMGSNAGAKLLTGDVGFLMSEGEWSRIILEMGPLIGWFFIIYRVALVCHLGLKSMNAAQKNRDPLPFLLFAACLPLVFNGQWNPPTILGFAVISAGLCLAACNNPPPVDNAPTYAAASKNTARRQLYR